MKCDHLKTKIKLVAWATDDRFGHQQGFKHVECCALCGCEIKKTVKKERL